jgi:methionine synthase I (cobalamin-dependent)
VEWANGNEEITQDNTPQLVKELIFMKYAIDGADWVETGTYKGTTTNFLSNQVSTCIYH